MDLMNVDKTGTGDSTIELLPSIIMGNRGSATLAGINRHYVTSNDWKLPPGFRATAASAHKG